MIDDPVQSAQNLGNPTITIPTVFRLVGLFTDCFFQESVLLWHLQFIPLCTTVLLKGLASLSLAGSQLLNNLIDGLTTSSRVYQFFEATSLRMAFSRARSATSLRKQAFSF
jgi:hypothetical protein